MKTTWLSQLSRRTALVAILAVVIAMVGTWLAYHTWGNPSPIPSDIKTQLSFKAVYPSKVNIDQNSFSYQAEQKTLSFTVKQYGADIVFTEQAVPGNLGSGSQVSFQSLGIHPYAQFQSKLGPVALTRAYDASGAYGPEGQLGVLVDNGTLLLAHPAQNQTLSDNQWKALFNSLQTAP